MLNNCLISKDYADGLWKWLQLKIEGMMPIIGDKSPHISEDGTYDDMNYDWWTSGFWPGILWIMYDMTGNEKYRESAWNWDEKIEQCFVKDSNLHHDVGFQFLPTAVIKYKLTGDTQARRRALMAANFLAGRFNIAGGFIRAWNQEKTGWSIIDTSMNLSLLFWAASEINDPRFAHIARAHADTVLKYFIREDGSVNHIVTFDPESGSCTGVLGGQGNAPDSAWSRGQAWAIYGLANVYKYTGDSKYLKGAQRVAHHFMASLQEDYVPYWDFRLPDFEGEPRDTSAAACAASGMLEIAKQLPAAEARMYINCAHRIIRSLTENYSTLNRPEYEGLLLGGTSNKPSGKGINVSLIYGDYYYVECIAKLLQWKHDIF